MPSTTRFLPGDIDLVSFPFGGSSQAKVRPAMVMLDTGDDDVVVARITTQQAHRTPHDVAIGEWQPAGLLAPSVVRLHKLATLEKKLIQRTLGRLQPVDRASVSAVLRQVFGQW